MENSVKNDMGAIPKKRDSNFELLRIVAMFMIVVYHIVVHCVMVEMAGGDTYIKISNTIFNQPIFYNKLFLLNIITPWGLTGNAIFLIISGYFMLPKGKNINLFKTSKKLLLQLGFSAITLMIVPLLVYIYKKHEVFVNLYNITDLNNFSWYIGYYFIIILFAALFLNKFLLGLSQKQFMTFLIVFFALFTFQWSRSVLEGIGSGLGTVATGIFCYAFGGYIKLYNPFQRVRLYVFPAIIFVIYLCIYISAYNTTQTNIENFNLTNVNGDGVFVQSVVTYANTSFIVVIIAICLFEIFRRIRLPHSRIINFLGQATFMVYLIHDSAFFYGIWGLKDWVSWLYDTPGFFLYCLAGMGAATFACGVAVYVVYLLIEKLFQRTKGIFVKKG